MENKLIAYLETFRGIPEEDKILLAEAFKNVSYREGAWLLTPRHYCREMFFVCSGVLRIVMQHDETGNEVTHFFLKENQFCTILKSFQAQTIAQEGIQAACDVEVMVISRARLLALYEKIPYLEGLISQIIQQALLDKVNLRNSYLGLDATGRYNLFVLQQADIATRVSLSATASYLGITQQSLSRIRRRGH